MFEHIKKAFPKDRAWAYIVEYDKVQIGIWDGQNLLFKGGFEEDNILELRIFKQDKELRFLRKKSELLLRDSAALQGKTLPQEQILYGTQAGIEDGGFTPLQEARGATLWFPGHVEPGIRLLIRNYYRFEPIPVLARGADPKTGILPGRGALEFYDYAFEGFNDHSGKEMQP